MAIRVTIEMHELIVGPVHAIQEAGHRDTCPGSTAGLPLRAPCSARIRSASPIIEDALSLFSLWIHLIRLLTVPRWTISSSPTITILAMATSISKQTTGSQMDSLHHPSSTNQKRSSRKKGLKSTER